MFGSHFHVWNELCCRTTVLTTVTMSRQVATPEAENRDPRMIDTGTSPFIISPAKDRKYPTKDLRDPSKDRNHLRYNSRRENMERAEVTAAKESSGEDDESTAVGSESTAADSEVHQGHRLDSKEGNMEHVFASTEFSVLANTDVRGGSLGGPEGVSAGSKGGPWEIRSCLSRARIRTG